MTEVSLRDRRILVVEDEMLIAMMLEDMLVALGCKVAARVAKEAQALEAIATLPLDAAILDLNLDGKESYKVAEALAAMQVPFVFASGYSAAAIDQRYRDRRLLQKPYRQEQLAEALKATLARA